jgi:hypothetical protein
VLTQLLLLESFGPGFIISINHLLCQMVCNVHSTLQLILCHFHVVAISPHVKTVSEVSLGMSYKHMQRKFYKLAKYCMLKYFFSCGSIFMVENENWLYKFLIFTVVVGQMMVLLWDSAQCRG